MAKLNGTLTLRRNRAKRGLSSNKRGRPKKRCRMAQEAQEAPEHKEQGPKASENEHLSNLPRSDKSSKSRCLPSRSNNRGVLTRSSTKLLRPSRVKTPNAVLKRSFHQNSQKGGGKGGSSKLLQVMYRMTRQLMWRVGHLDGLFDHLGYDESLTIDYGKQKVMPKFKHVHREVLEEYAKSLVKFPSLSDMESSLELVNNDENGTDVVSI